MTLTLTAAAVRNGDALYPSATLFPSTTLFPSELVGLLAATPGSLSLPAAPVGALTLTGA